MIQKRTLSENQAKAADPSQNVWVQANAGTGKTSVLVQRLLQILFRSPDLDNTGILCLTYTNAAAGEMRNRILQSLRDWVCASDEELADVLYDISEDKKITPKNISDAKEIFYKYIDNPEILKIKTIHGFCEEILHRFPIEAGISPSWSLIQDSSKKILLQEAFYKMVTSNTNPLNLNINDTFMYIVDRISEYQLDKLLNILSEQYKYFFQVKDFIKYRQYYIDTTKKFLNLNSEQNTEIPVQNLKNILEEIKSTKNPAKTLIEIANLIEQLINNSINFEEYKKGFLTQDGTIRKFVKDRDYLLPEAERVLQIEQRNLNETIFKDSLAMFDLSAVFSKIYMDMKKQHNFLDFDDLLLYTKKLFSSPENMGWVLSQLNISLSHILVDEAQDTSPLQWDILRLLAGDFFTEGDTEKSKHSLFVVGDTKQSIYGFQGADPKAFAVSRTDIGQQIKENQRVIQDVPLAQSFRSLPVILNTVDTFFNDPDIIASTGFVNNTHKTFRDDATGLVEIYRAAEKETVSEYINTIATKIKSLIQEEGFQAKDIMVLVQKRTPFGAALVNELKRQDIEVAGSDRIVLPDYPPIRDLLYLVRFCLNQDDDYSLCCVLKSPLFRLKERDIFNLCSVKNDENKSKKSTSPDFIKTTVFDVLKRTNSDISETLEDFIEMSKTLAPYSFFTKVLETKNNRQEIISALGEQVIDPLEEFLTICLAYERTQPGTIKHFLKWFITGESEIKRDMDASAGVRVVTVHGSKGLEAKVIFLIDTLNLPNPDDTIKLSKEVLSEYGCNQNEEYPDLWLWTKGGGNSIQYKDAKEFAERLRIEEYYRLLYVAMTRARDRLYIYGQNTGTKAPEKSWMAKLESVLSTAPNAIIENGTIRFTK